VPPRGRCPRSVAVSRAMAGHAKGGLS
jgi:hypothetical protein